MLSSGTRVQYTQPPNGSLNGAPSTRTSVRLTPLGPMPRSDTPCDVGCDDRLLVRRNRLNVGICRRTSSATTAGDDLMSSLVSTLTLAGMSPARCSLRAGVTVTVSRIAAGDTTISSSRARSLVDTRAVFSAKPPARTTSVTSSPSGVSTEKRPSGPVTVCRSAPDAGLTTTAAPTTAPPTESRTTPVRGVAAARTKNSAAITVVLFFSDYPLRPVAARGFNENAISAASSPAPVAMTTNWRPAADR